MTNLRIPNQQVDVIHGQRMTDEWYRALSRIFIDTGDDIDGGDADLTALQAEVDALELEVDQIQLDIAVTETETTLTRLMTHQNGIFESVNIGPAADDTWIMVDGVSDIWAVTDATGLHFPLVSV